MKYIGTCNVPDCGKRVYMTPSGNVCEDYHGGADYTPFPDTTPEDHVYRPPAGRVYREDIPGPLPKAGAATSNAATALMVDYVLDAAEQVGWCRTCIYCHLTGEPKPAHSCGV